MGILDETRRGGHLGDDHGFVGLQAVDAHLSILVTAIDAVGIADDGTVGVGHLELGVLQGNAGICGAHLADQEGAVRGVFKADGDHRLLAAVRQEHRLGGLEDGIIVPGIDLLHEVGAWVEPRPHTRSIGAGFLLPDDGAARARRAAQPAQLEGDAAQRLMADGIVLLDHDRVFGHIFELNLVGFARFQVNILRIGRFDGEAGGALQFADAVPSGVDVLQDDLAGLVGVEHAQVVELAGDGVVAAPPDLEFDIGDGALCDAVHLQNFEGGLDDIGELQGGGAVFLQLDDVHRVIMDIIGGRFHLENLVGPGPEVLPENDPIGPSLPLVGKAAVHLLNLEGNALDELARLGVPLHEAQARQGGVDEVHHDILVLGGVDPHGFAVVGIHDPGGGHRRLLDFVAPTRQGLQHGFAVRPGDHIVLVADVDPADVEGGVGDRVAGLRVPLLDGEGALVVVDLSDHDGLLALEILCVHMDANGGFVAVEARWGGHLHKFVMALGDVGHRDGAIRTGFLGGDDLSVTQDKKNSASQGAAALIHLLQLNLHLGAVLKYQTDIVLPIPHEGLLYFGDIGAEDESLRGSDFLGQKAARGQFGEVQLRLGDVAAVPGDVLAEEASAVVQLDAGDADHRAGDAHSGVITIHLADGAVALFFIGLVVEGEGVCHGAIGHHRHCLGDGLGHVPLRHSLLSDGVLARGEAVCLGQRQGAVRAGGFCHREGAGIGSALHLEGDPAQGLVCACLQLFDGELHTRLLVSFIRDSDQKPLHGHPGLARQHPGLGFIPVIQPQVVVVVILGMVQHQVDPGGDIVIGGVAGDTAVGAVNNTVRPDFTPIRDERGLAVSVVVELHCSDKLLRRLLNKAFPVSGDVLDDAVLIVPAHRLPHHEPDVGPVVTPGF